MAFPHLAVNRSFIWRLSVPPFGGIHPLRVVRRWERGLPARGMGGASWPRPPLAALFRHLDGHFDEPVPRRVEVGLLLRHEIDGKNAVFKGFAETAEGRSGGRHLTGLEDDILFSDDGGDVLARPALGLLRRHAAG